MKARFLALAALVLGMVSCQQDFDGAAQVGGEVDFQLSVAASELGKTRADLDGDEQNGHNSAYGAIDYFEADWASVDLRYTLEVYDALKEGETTYGDPVKKRMVKVVDSYQPVNFDLRLVAGRDYRFVVFADFVKQGATAEPTIEDQAELGLRHNIGADLRDITVKNDAINDEYADAYFVSETLTINNSQPQAVELKRPYAKVRVVATDLAELNLNVDPKSVVVTYDASHPTQFNAVTGSIKAEQTPVVFACDYVNDEYSHYTAGYDAEYFEDIDTQDPRYTHKTLFTDYILAKDDQEPIHFTMSVYDNATERNENTLIKETKFNTEIPVQRNHLTTIIGNVLTTATEINVSINDNFEDVDGCHDINVVPVNTAKELQEALDAYKNGQTILFDANIKGDVLINQKEGVDYVIDGNGYKFDGVMEINGDARQAGEDSVTIRNINFETAKTNINAIDSNENKKYGKNYNYAHNVTIENCTFNLGEGSAALKFRQSKNVVVMNCEMIAGHSMAQFYGVNDVVVANVKVAAKNGISFGTSTGVELKNSTIVAEGYGVRADASVATNLNLENVNITAQFPVIARKYSNADYAINFFGNNTLVAPGYQVVLTKGADDAEVFEAPEVEFAVNGAEEFAVFPSEKKFAYNQASLQYFLNNTADGDVIKLAADIVGDVKVTQKADVKFTIDGQNYNYAGVIVVDGKSATYTTAGLTIKNLNFNADTISADACIRLGDGTSATRYTCNVTVEGCTFDVPGAVGVKSYTGGDKNLVVKNCEATAKAHSLLQAKGIDRILVEGCTVNSKNGLNFNNSNNVVVNECNANVRGYAVRFGEGSGNNAVETYAINNSRLESACEDGDSVIILRGSADIANLTLSNTEIVGAIKIANNVEANIVYNATEGTIDFSDADYGTINLGVLKNVTIKGNENTSVIFNTTADSKLENVTLKTINFTYDGNNTNFGVVINKDAQIDNLVIDGCSFVGTGEKKGRGLYGQNSNATISFKNCVFENLGYPIYTMSAGGYKSLTIEGCTFRLIKSWAVMPQYNDYLGDLTVTGCTFENCTGGLVKAGKFTVGHTFTFTNNVVTNSAEHPAKNWFTIDTSAAAKVVSGNTKDGAVWTPADAEGLK